MSEATRDPQRRRGGGRRLLQALIAWPRSLLEAPLLPRILGTFLAVLVVASLATLVLETRITREGLRAQAADLVAEQGSSLDRTLALERVATGQLMRAIVQQVAVEPATPPRHDRAAAAETALSLVRNASPRIEFGAALDVASGEVFAEVASRHRVVPPGPLGLDAGAAAASRRVVELVGPDGTTQYGLVHAILADRVTHPYLLAVGYPLDDNRARTIRHMTGTDAVELVVDGQVVASIGGDDGRSEPLGDWAQTHEPQVLPDGRTVRYVQLGSEGEWDVPAAVGLIAADPLAALDSRLARTRAMMVVLLVVVGGALAFALARVMTRPVVQLTETAAAIAGGDLDRSFHVARRDEIGTLARVLEGMRRALRTQLLVIRQQAEALRQAARRIAGAQDAERRRIAQDLHDGIQQQLVVLRMQVGVARGQLEQDPARIEEVTDGLASTIDQLLDDLRRTGQALYPSILRDRGLGGALFSLAGRSEIPLDVRLRPDPLPRLGEELEANAYFLAAEAITNVLRHARAERILVEARHEGDALQLRIQDDGIGFDPATCEHAGGLVHMRDRVNAFGGSLQLRSRPGEGTTVRAVFPLPEQDASVAGALEVEQDRGDAAVEVDLLGEAELAEDRVGMLLDGPGGDRQFPGDRGVPAAGRHEPEDVELPRGQTREP